MSPPDRRFERIGGRTVFEGRIISVHVDRFRYADGDEEEREIVRHVVREVGFRHPVTAHSKSCVSPQVEPSAFADAGVVLKKNPGAGPHRLHGNRRRPAQPPDDVQAVAPEPPVQPVAANKSGWRVVCKNHSVR